jgi:hypothetical protein
VLPENFLKSLAKRRRLLVDTGEKTWSTQSGRLETVWEPAVRARELWGIGGRNQKEPAGATGRTNAVRGSLLKAGDFLQTR